MKCRNCERESGLEDVDYCPYCGERLPSKLKDIPILEEYTNGEVKKHFKRLYELAVKLIEYKAEHGYEMKDSNYWCWESVMKILGEDIYDKWNKLN